MNKLVIYIYIYHLEIEKKNFFYWLDRKMINEREFLNRDYYH